MAASDQSPVMLGCCPSSGSTLLSVILDAHPKILCGSELNLFSHPFVWRENGRGWRARLLRALFTFQPFLKDWTLRNGFVPYAGLVDVENLAWYGYSIFSVMNLIRACDTGRELADQFWMPVLERYGKSIWAEKSPPNIYGLPYFLDAYPNGRGIVIVRDGRDVVCSLQRRNYSLRAAISCWLLETTISLELSRFPRVLLVRYEDLVSSPQRTLEIITGFLGLEPETERLLGYAKYTNRDLRDKKESVKSWSQHPAAGIKASSVNRWQQELTAEDLEMFYAHKIRPDQSLFLPDITLPQMTTVELLETLRYSVPDLQPLGRPGLSDFFLAQANLEENAETFHEKHTELNFQGNGYLVGPEFTARSETGNAIFQASPAKRRKPMAGYIILAGKTARKILVVLLQAIKVWAAGR